ncbi:DUF6175 family protein [Parabacteroides gordonii]|jgi:hemerythrin|uniref:DUF6175 family protein n=1 Tax=Parabacteroides gordonii TaxID=574930 RepID=UPI00325B88E7
MRAYLSFTLLLALMFCFELSAWSKKPTIMILPSNNWCNQRYFITKYFNQGTIVTIPNYSQAFQEDVELPQVISKIGELLTVMGYSLKDAEQEIKTLQVKIAEDNVTTSKTHNASLIETPLDILKRRIKSDIIIQIDWTINTTAKGNSVSFTLEAFDTYTNKRIATSTGVSKKSKKMVPILLEQAIQEHINPFDKQMDDWYTDQQENGREILLTVRCWDNWDRDLETEYNGEELTDCIQRWLDKHTVKSVYNLSDGSESFLQFEQVRIPFMNEKGKAQDARDFATDLRKYLQKEPFEITSKVIMRGLGEAIIILGEK